jgi:hypothetical protein
MIWRPSSPTDTMARRARMVKIAIPTTCRMRGGHELFEKPVTGKTAAS